MRKGRLIMLLAALICTGIACKKNEGSLNKESEALGVTAEQQAQLEAQFETATGLNVVNQTPFNADNRLVFATVQEAASYFNVLKNTTIPIEDPNQLPSLPAPDDQGNGCPDCKVVTFVCTMPFHASILIGRIYFKKDASSPQYNYVNDTWHASGFHLGLNTSTPMVISMSSYTRFNFNKLIEYYVGIRIGGIDITASWWYRVDGNGDVNNPFGAGLVSPIPY